MHPINKLHRFKISLKKAKRRVSSWWDIALKDKKWLTAELQIKRNTTKPCSCDECCNPRHCTYNKPEEKMTMQERKDKLNVKEQMDVHS